MEKISFIVSFFIVILPLFCLVKRLKRIIQMEHDQGTKKMATTDDTSIPFIKPLTLADVPQINRTRLILLILNVICIVSF